MNYKKLALSFAKALIMASIAYGLAKGPIWLTTILAVILVTAALYLNSTNK